MVCNGTTVGRLVEKMITYPTSICSTETITTMVNIGVAHRVVP